MQSIDVSPEVIGRITCGTLRSSNAGQEVTLRGWVNRRRDLGGLIFIDLRDRFGITQVVFNPQVEVQAHEIASGLRNEYVIAVTGIVNIRPEGTENPRMDTGQVELEAHQLEILNEAKTPPFYINEEVDVDESLRLKYRYLDLRRPHMQRNILLRYEIVKMIRHYLGRAWVCRCRDSPPDQEHA